jgi:hypothetical protein
MHFLGVLLPTVHHLLHPLPHHGSATTVSKGNVDSYDSTDQGLVMGPLCFPDASN